MAFLETPLTINFGDITEAAAVLKGIAHRTPVMTSRQFNARMNAEVFFKCENFQRGGAFKFRGAYHAISQLDDAAKQRGIVAFSSGNHAQAVALSSRLLSIDAIIVMPTDSPQTKLAATKEYGGNVVLYDRQTEDREAVAARYVSEQGRTLIPPFDHAHIIAGQGTATLELIEDVGKLDAIFTCVGGGGLSSGTVVAAKHLLPDCRVIGVEPEAGNDAAQSLRSGKIVHILPPDTIADGARTQSLGKLPFHILRALLDEMIDVSDDELRAQMRFFLERMKIVVEPTGCLAAAGALKLRNAYAGKRIGIIVSGGNVDL